MTEIQLPALDEFQAFRREKARREKAAAAAEAATDEERNEFAAWQAEQAAKREAATARKSSKQRSSQPVQHRGQLRMAERFVQEQANNLRHVHRIGWHYWAQSHWCLDPKRVDIEAAVQTLKNALRSLPSMNGQARDDLYDDISKCESASAIEGMVKIAGGLPPLSTSAADLDSDPNLFNTPNGTVDLSTGEVKPNNRADLITKVSGGKLGGSRCKEWEAFLVRILPDEDVRKFVQRLCGYAMLGKVTEHVMPIFTGAGANGKGTLRDALLSAFGDYAIEVDPAILMESKHERHGTFKMRLRGARLVFCSETEKGKKFAEATMKRLVGGDQIEANLMHKDPITFDPSHTLIMLTNHLPAVSGDDPAVWRRILVVPFDVVIPENERDGSLPERLKRNPTAVLSWAYEGWRDYQKQGLNPPEVVRVRTREYQLNSDVLGRFLDERTIKTAHGVEKARDVYAAWSAWCRDTKEEPGSEVEFANSMTQRGYEKKRSAAGQTYRGLMLASEDDDEQP